MDENHERALYVGDLVRCEGGALAAVIDPAALQVRVAHKRHDGTVHTWQLPRTQVRRTIRIGHAYAHMTDTKAWGIAVAQNGDTLELTAVGTLQPKRSAAWAWEPVVPCTCSPRRTRDWGPRCPLCKDRGYVPVGAGNIETLLPQAPADEVEAPPPAALTVGLAVAHKTAKAWAGPVASLTDATATVDVLGWGAVTKPIAEWALPAKALPPRPKLTPGTHWVTPAGWVGVVTAPGVLSEVRDPRSLGSCLRDYSVKRHEVLHPVILCRHLSDPSAPCQCEGRGYFHLEPPGAAPFMSHRPTPRCLHVDATLLVALDERWARYTLPDRITASAMDSDEGLAGWRQVIGDVLAATAAQDQARTVGLEFAADVVVYVTSGTRDVASVYHCGAEVATDTPWVFVAAAARSPDPPATASQAPQKAPAAPASPVAAPPNRAALAARYSTNVQAFQQRLTGGKPPGPGRDVACTGCDWTEDGYEGGPACPDCGAALRTCLPAVMPGAAPPPRGYRPSRKRRR